MVNGKMLSLKERHSKITGSLTEIKEHISEDHRKGSPAHYSFSYYKCHSKDNSEKEVKK